MANILSFVSADLDPGAVAPYDPAWYAKTVAQVVWNGSALVDLQGNSWTQVGTVPQVAASGSIPAGAGPFSDSNYYQLGSGTDPLDFASDFSACVVFGIGTIPLAGTTKVFFNNGTANTDGYYLEMTTSGTVDVATDSPAGHKTTVAFVPATQSSVNVACFGRAGLTQLVKMNLSPTLTGPAAPVTPATTTPARIGRYSTTGFFADLTLYELWFSTTTPSDYLFSFIARAIRTRLGITAW